MTPHLELFKEPCIKKSLESMSASGSGGEWQRLGSTFGAFRDLKVSWAALCGIVTKPTGCTGPIQQRRPWRPRHADVGRALLRLGLIRPRGRTKTPVLISCGPLGDNFDNFGNLGRPSGDSFNSPALVMGFV